MKMQRRRRAGATAVEFALVCPIVFVTFLVSIEFCRVHMIRHTMQNVVYEAARLGLVPGTSNGKIESAAKTMMEAVSVSKADVSASQNDEEVTVQMTVDYKDAAWVSPIVFTSSKLKAAITLAREES